MQFRDCFNDPTAEVEHLDISVGGGGGGGVKMSTELKHFSVIEEQPFTNEIVFVTDEER